MAYTPIVSTRYDAESPITDALMSDIIENIESLLGGGAWTVVTGSGTYSVPSGVTKLRVIGVSGGGGGGAYRAAANNPGGGGGSGQIKDFIYTPSAGELSSGISYGCGAGGAGGSAGDGSPGGDTTFGTETITGGEEGFDDNTGGNKTEVTRYYGGIGGDGGGNGGGAAGLDGYNYLAPVSGTPGAGGAAGAGDGGGGGAPMIFPFSFDGLATNLGDGGAGGTNASSSGSNATTYGAGGGGTARVNDGPTGGNGSAGIIFISIQA